MILMYATIDAETKLLLNIAVFDRHGAYPAAAFRPELAEKHALSDVAFLIGGYRTALLRIGVSGQLDATERNHFSI